MSQTLPKILANPAKQLNHIKEAKISKMLKLKTVSISISISLSINRFCVVI
jgi:hypothetical protein